MKRVLFLTNIPSPYRINFFEELGSFYDVTVLFHDDIKKHTSRANNWFGKGEGGFYQIQLNKKFFSHGEDTLCIDVIKWLKIPFDHIVICGYASMTEMLAIAYLRMIGKPFFLEVDGGFIRSDSKIKYKLKRWLVSSATGWISSGKNTTNYLLHYGADADHVYEYPFSSLKKEDIMDVVPSMEEKKALRKKLNITEEKCVLSVGRFLHGKGFDVLLKSAITLEKTVGIYIVGGEPTEEYLKIIKEFNLSNVHFVDFKPKCALGEYYKAADVFVLPTRGDVWGLVINEAMAYALPVITTDVCIAGLELVSNDVNGYIVPVDNSAELSEKIKKVLNSDCRKMGESSLAKIRSYTIENMAKAHVEIFESRG